MTQSDAQAATQAGTKAGNQPHAGPETHPQARLEPQPHPGTGDIDCVFDTILGFLLPFFLTGAAGNVDAAKAAVRQLIEAYNASTATELDLVGRIIGFSVAAMDNLRLSMTQGLSDTRILRYRCNAVTLSRASDQARKLLEATQAQRPTAQRTPRPSVATALPAALPVAATPAHDTRSLSAAPPQRVALPANSVLAGHPPLDIEAMKRDARIMMQAFSKHGAQVSSSVLTLPDPASAARAAAAAAVATVRRTAAA